MMLNFAIPCSGRNQNGIIKTGLASEYQQQQSASGRDLQGYCRDHQTESSGVSGMRPYTSRIHAIFICSTCEKRRCCVIRVQRSAQNPKMQKRPCLNLQNCLELPCASLRICSGLFAGATCCAAEQFFSPFPQKLLIN